MVFRGQPSKACQRCRTRRLRCDLRQDGCSACRRAGSTCFGYRDVPSLRIHDETTSLQHPSCPRATSYALQPAIEPQARDVLVHHCTLSPRGWEFMLQIHAGQPNILSMSLDALSVAFLSRYQSSPSLLQHARKRYASALQSLQRSLVSITNTRAKIEMLASTMLLDLFEKIANHRPEDKKSWLIHLRGSISIVMATGFDNLKSPFALQLLMRLVSHCTIGCITNSVPVPAELWQIQRHISVCRGLDGDFPWDISGILMEFASFRSAIRNPAISLRACIALGQGIDEKLSALPDTAPGSPGLDSTDWDAYEKWEMQNVLTFRFLICEALLEKHYNLPNEKPPVDSFFDTVPEHLSAMASHLRSAIALHSTCLDHKPLANKRSRKPPRMDSHGRPKLSHSPSQTFSCYVYLFPLYLLGRSYWTAPDQKDWAKSHLLYIHQHFGISNALSARKLLENPPELDHWQVFAMLGCA
ncbi:C6 transcription factor [Penicillium capsulatum]|uniref:C6 transcription factor n=1 Tax=Penicillium capsulatum TaxID=69766 RepID=A0A9W9IJM0_9EURO|nr:C6 transcription factor [Penicillium capsulatum]KAJ6122816.1 C6 transcription factor [Penicillium capsulatum]